MENTPSVRGKAVQGKGAAQGAAGSVASTANRGDARLLEGDAEPAASAALGSTDGGCQHTRG